MVPVLIASKTSPFGRITRVVRSELGLEKAVSIKLFDAAEARKAASDVSPLGKSPVLIIDSGSFICDSRIITSYFHDLASPLSLWLPGRDRFVAESEMALAQGIMEAALLLLYEETYHDKQERSSTWLDHQRAKVERAVAFLTSSILQRGKAGGDLSEITFLIALDYLVFRFPKQFSYPSNLEGWRKSLEEQYPGLRSSRP